MKDPNDFMLVESEGDQLRKANDYALRLRAALSIALGGLKTIGSDYPGSSCEQFCNDLIDRAESTASGDEKP